MHLITLEIQSKRRDGTMGRMTRDLLIPARPGTRKEELLWLANKLRDTMPKKDRYAIDLLRKRYSERYTKRVVKTITIAEGPPTRARKAKLR